MSERAASETDRAGAAWRLPADGQGAPRFACRASAGALGSKWIEVHGELDIATCATLREELAGALATARLVAVDLRGVSFMDSAGIHVLLDAAGAAQACTKRLLVVRGSGQVARVLELSALEKRVLVVDLPTDESGAAGAGRGRDPRLSVDMSAGARGDLY